jgi:hypothetical protein
MTRIRRSVPFLRAAAEALMAVSVLVCLIWRHRPCDSRNKVRIDQP